MNASAIRLAPWFSGSSVVTTIAWTAAWLTNSCPASSRIAADIATRDHDDDLPRPAAEQLGEPVGDHDADRHADRDLADPAEPLPVRRPEAEEGRHRCEERRLVAEHLRGDHPCHPGRDGALGDHPRLRLQSAESGGHRQPAALDRLVAQRGQVDWQLHPHIFVNASPHRHSSPTCSTSRTAT